MTDPTRCPLCDQPNACRLACGSSSTPAGGECWCASVEIAPNVLAKIPEPARGLACICADCARRRDTSDEPAP
ncbi:MAG: cysteine-rich CWC family protein [bacterium]|nr:cysteine-rich CWC family protein [bacterium]